MRKKKWNGSTPGTVRGKEALGSIEPNETLESWATREGTRMKRTVEWLTIVRGSIPILATRSAESEEFV